jgi:excisionase family DNA binding protein
MNANTGELTPLWYTIDQAAQILNKSRVSIYAAAKQGKLKITKDGRSSRITPAELERYVRTCTEQQAA